MADTYTQALKARKIEPGAYDPDWSERFNEDVVDILDAGISGQVTIDIGSNTTYTLAAMVNGTLSDSHYWRLNIIGTPASAVTFTIPASVTPSKEYLIDNQTGQAVTVKYAATAGVTVQDGDVIRVLCDGTTVAESPAASRFKITPAEIAAGVTPTDASRQPLPIIDIRRHGFAEGRTEAQNAASIADAVSVLLEESAGGGVIQLPPGKFNADPFLVPANVLVRGAGLQATWLTNGDTGTFVTLGSSANTGVLKYGCGLRDLALFCDHRNGNAIYLRECAAAKLDNLYLENNGRTGNTDTCAAVTIDGGNVSSFFNVLTLVMANHWHYNYRILTSGTTIPTQSSFFQCSAFGDVASDNGSIGLDIVAVGGGEGQQSAWHGGNIESCAIGVKHGATTGPLMFFGLRTEANTLDVQFGLTCAAQAYIACLLDLAKIQDNSGTGYERHTFFACHTATGAQFGNQIPGATILRAAVSAAEIPLKIKGYPSQTADLLQLLNSSDALQFGVTPDGSIKRVIGLSGTTTKANNLRGSATFAAATTVAVTFATAEADASYYVEVTPQADPVGRIWVSGKGTGGFTINNSSSTSITVDWVLIR